MTKWKDIKTAPKDGEFLTKEFRGLFGAGWVWNKTIRVRDKFFNVETKEEIQPTHWAEVTL